MTKFTWNVNADILRAALICVSTEETRYYLNGISFEPNAQNARIVSTDGHRLFVAKIDKGEGTLEKFILPHDAAIQALNKYKPELITIERDGNTWSIGSALFKPVDGTFPDWTRIFPKEIPSVPVAAAYNPKYLADMDKMASHLNGRNSHAIVYSNGNNPALVTFGERTDCMAVIMPKRIEALDKETVDALAAEMVSIHV